MRVVEEKSFKDFFTNYPATTTILMLTIILHLLTYVLGNGSTDYETARKFGALLSSNKDFTELPYLLTSTYQHIGGMLHLVMNVGFIVISAPYLEELFGSLRFVILYNLTGIAGSFVSLLFSENSISSGASAAGYGLMGIYIALIILQRAKLDSEMKQTILILFVIGIAMTFAVPGISITGHLGGLFAGMILGSIIPTTRKHYSPAEGALWAITIPVALFVLLTIPQHTGNSEHALKLFANERLQISNPLISNMPSEKEWLYERYREDIYVHTLSMINLYSNAVSNQINNPQEEISTILKTIQKNKLDAQNFPINVSDKNKQSLLKLYDQLEKAAITLQTALSTMDYPLFNQYVLLNDQLVEDAAVFLEELKN